MQPLPHSSQRRGSVVEQIISPIISTPRFTTSRFQFAGLERKNRGVMPSHILKAGGNVIRRRRREA